MTEIPYKTGWHRYDGRVIYIQYIKEHGDELTGPGFTWGYDETDDPEFTEFSPGMSFDAMTTEMAQG